ncbi:uncharacterized protein RCC_03967 [Ramularia collo-cygni]|uniref:SNF2 N-terminal domain-containing protein n=1 Tax=Ramularia collo-cygni TaxID=112498 RepID=A0A2D3V0D5_9PEZI|nr:uncharacterized protein RCC_03967 [Ramularia collo-cygni]CZT18127.1 uncharacterized protein RCC_03967 [Ramularia collo-cygni]
MPPEYQQRDHRSAYAIHHLDAAAENAAKRRRLLPQPPPRNSTPTGWPPVSRESSYPPSRVSTPASVFARLTTDCDTPSPISTAPSPAVVELGAYDDTRRRQSTQCLQENKGCDGQEHSDIEVCFGMLTDIGLNVHKPAHIPPFAPIETVGTSVRLSHTDCEVGLVSERDAYVINTLQSEARVTLQMFVHFVTADTPKRSGRMNSRPCVYVILYGRRRLGESLGEFLDECKLYLQDPIRCAWDVEYVNAQSLFQISDKPITTFQLERESEDQFEAYQSPGDILADLENGSDLRETPTPTSLRTPLHPHQKQALTFMRKREKGWAFHDQESDVWHCQRQQDGALVYINNISEEISDVRPADFRGGIIGDTMGLGKSLSAIALIASDKDDAGLPRSSHPTTLAHVGTTLLVVKAPLIKTWGNQFDLEVPPACLNGII